jgi:RNA polymerase sigma factor (sigma-70 family)
MIAPAPNDREVVFEQLRKRIVSYLIRNRGFRTDQAEDIAQRTMLAILAKPPQLAGGEADLVPWCIGVARNLASEQLRENQRFVAEPWTGWWASLEDRATGLKADAIAELEPALRELGEQCRELLRRRLDREESVAIAALLKISLDTLYVREHRCRENLRKILVSRRRGRAANAR